MFIVNEIFLAPEATANIVSLCNGQYEYLWADGAKYKKPVRLSAPEYIEKLFVWIEGQMDDEAVFPIDYGKPFPPNFRDIVRRIFKRLFRVYAHIYHSHFKSVVALGVEAHLNTCFKHFIYFTKVRSHAFSHIKDRVCFNQPCLQSLNESEYTVVHESRLLKEFQA